MNVVRGINFSVRDENLHCLGGAWLFRTLMAEKLRLGEINEFDLTVLQSNLTECAKQVAEHEFHIVDKIFEKGEMEGITAEQMKTFVKSWSESVP